MTVASVPGESVVRISQAGHLLSFDVPTSALPLTPDSSPLTPLELPQLLVGTDSNATGITVNSNGQVKLTGSGIGIENGDVVAKTVTAQEATLSAAHSLTLVESQLHTTSNLNLLARDTVRVRDSLADSFLAQAGGNLYIQGDQGIDILALNHSETPFNSGGNLTLVSNGIISGDAHFTSQGNFSTRNLSGGLGNFISLHDPIISSGGDVTFGDYTGAALKVEARGSITGNNITITEPDASLSGSDPDIAVLTSSPALILRTGLATANPLNVSQSVGGTKFTSPGGPSPGTITISGINTSSGNGNGGSIVLSATGKITTGGVDSSSVNLNGGSISFTSSNGEIATGFLNSSSANGSAGAITLTGNGNITTSNVGASSSGSSDGNGGNIRFTSSNGAIATGFLNSSSANGSAGAIALAADGNITTGDINSTGRLRGGGIDIRSIGGVINTSVGRLNSISTSGDSGNITLAASGDITTGSVNSNSVKLNSGRISFTSRSGAIATGFLNSSSTGNNAGAITLAASGNITTSNVGASSSGLSANSNGGDIKLTSTNGAIATGFLNSSSTGNNAGAITLAASGNITTSNVGASSSGLSANSNGGDIKLTSTNGAIATGFLRTSSTTGNGGAIVLAANSSTTTNNMTSAGATAGGQIIVSALDRIASGRIDSSSISGNGGSVTLNSQGNVRVTSINAQSESGTGGNVDITTARFFQALDTFIDQKGVTVGISTVGTRGGAIVIRHGGGVTGKPFVVGNATTNGTAGAITTNGNTISPTQAFPGNYTQGNIRLITPTPQTCDLLSCQSLQHIVADKSNTGGRNDSSIISSDPERDFTRKFEEYLKLPPKQSVSLEDAQNKLSQIEAETGVKPALIYVRFVPTQTTTPEVPSVQTKSREKSQKPEIWLKSKGFAVNRLFDNLQPQENSQEQDRDQMELVLVTAKGNPIRKRIPTAMRSQVLKVTKNFERRVTDINDPDGYLDSAHQLYQWMVAPLLADLQARSINNLVFILDDNLRSLPLAALHDGHKFLVEKYSVGLMPSLSLTDTRYTTVKNTQVLAMGASQFTDQDALPAVPVELATIVQHLWSGKFFLNQAFTLNNLKLEYRKQSFGIIHLATHAEFQPGELKNSYIQFWEAKLQLDRIRQLGLNHPPVELLVLSACRTAVGDENAELGFAGIAAQAGVKSVLASLWYVSDEGTLGLMTEFYQQLKTAPIKAEALRQAQIAMLRGHVLLHNGKLSWSGGEVLLPTELANGDVALLHPYYWAAFTMIGSPW